MSTTAPPRPPRPPQPQGGQPAGHPHRPAPVGSQSHLLEARRRAQAVALRRSIVLTLMSVLLPGSAQLVAGSRRVGRIALRVWLVLIVVGALIAWRADLSTLARLSVNSWFLLVLRFGGLAIGAGWALLILDAWRLSRPPRLRRGHRALTLLVSLALAAAVFVPFQTASRYAQAQRDLVTSVFPSGKAAETTGGRLNVLLLGSDAGKGRDGVRPDSITLASIDTLTGRATLISLPRNLQKARFPDGSPAAAKFPSGFSGDGDLSNYLLNATYTYGVDHPDMFSGPAGPGIEAVKQAVSGTLDQPIHYYALVNLAGFAGIVDALGGLTIRVESEITFGTSDRVLKPGLQTLDGYETLWYARSRTGSSDYVRMSRQRCVLNGILQQADPKALLLNFDRLANSAQAMITTDIPAAQLPDLVELALLAKQHAMSSVQFVPPLIVPANPDVDLMRRKTAEAIKRTGPSAAQSADAGPAGTGSTGPASAGTRSGGTGSAGTGSAGTGSAGTGSAGSDVHAPEIASLSTACRYS